jgi:hypothetical protein
MAKTWSVAPAVVVTALTAFVGGGLAGSVFSWLVNRREPTVITYSVNQTQLADPTATVLIPNLTVNVGKETIRELHAYTIDLDVPQGGRSERARIGIFFPQNVRIYGKSTEAPSQLYSITCNQIDNGLTCEIFPVSRANNKPYRIILATDEKNPPHVEIALADARIVPASEYLTQKSGIWGSISTPKTLAELSFVLIAIAVLMLQARLLTRVAGLAIGKGGGIVVGKIVNADGNPIPDADVEVALESPAYNFPPTKTDRFGDFILGSLRKFSLYKGRIRITHANYVPVDTQIDSPIVSLKLDRKADTNN